MSKHQEGQSHRDSDMYQDMYQRVHQLVTDLFEQGGAEDSSDEGSAVQAELSELLASDKVAQQIYVDYMHETSTLRASAVSKGSRPDQFLEDIASQLNGQSPPARFLNARLLGWFATAACLLAALGVTFLPKGPQPSPEGTDPGSVAASAPSPAASVGTLTRLIGVEWEPDSDAPLALSRVKSGQRLCLSSGQAEIVFDTGVELLITGPADIRVDSAMRVISSLGTFAARVGDAGKGFTIDTPVTRVIDLGTEYGVTIAGNGDTGVAVFKGAVDLDTAIMGSARSKDRKRLHRGEALRVGSDGSYQRIVSINSREFPTAGSRSDPQGRSEALITEVSDNLRDSASANFYRIVPGGLKDDVLAFVDREHEWNSIEKGGLPDLLRGADYVMPFNNDKSASEIEVTVSLAKPCNFYVFLDNNMPIPDWLTAEFVDTGVDIGLDLAKSKLTPKAKIGVGAGVSVDNRFSVWQRLSTEAGDVSLGSVQTPVDKLLGWNMFGMAATPLQSADDVR